MEYYQIASATRWLRLGGAYCLHLDVLVAVFQAPHIQPLLQSRGLTFFYATVFQAFAKDLFHTHLHCLQLAKCGNLTCKWQRSRATAEVISLIHWHFWDSETKNVWTLRRRAFVSYTNSSPCSAYAIVIIYSDSQPSSLGYQPDTKDREAYSSCPFLCPPNKKNHMHCLQPIQCSPPQTKHPFLLRHSFLLMACWQGHQQRGDLRDGMGEWIYSSSSLLLAVCSTPGPHPLLYMGLIWPVIVDWVLKSQNHRITKLRKDY